MLKYHGHFVTAEVYMMKILGIDPGYALMGYGIISQKGNSFSVCDYGSISTEAGTPLPDRLKFLYSSLMNIIAEHQPDTAAIEELFFNNNAKTVINVGQARGVAILACINSGLEIAEYTPLQIKQALVGHGRAEKQQVQQMVKILLGLESVPKPDDTADALAVAVCHAHSANGASRLALSIEKALQKESKTSKNRRSTNEVISSYERDKENKNTASTRRRGTNSVTRKQNGEAFRIIK